MTRMLAVMFLTWACSCKSLDPYVATGETINMVGQEFLVVGDAMNKAIDANMLTKEQYDRWVAFVEKFKVSHALARRTWKFALANDDNIAKGDATNIILNLSAELAEFMALAVELADHRRPPEPINLTPYHGNNRMARGAL